MRTPFSYSKFFYCKQTDYSVENFADFNKKCDMVYQNGGTGIEIMLTDIKERFMTEYEILSESCKIAWRGNLNIKNGRVTQVSGYVFNERNQLLIVKNNDVWTIPGGIQKKTKVKRIL